MVTQSIVAERSNWIKTQYVILFLIFSGKLILAFYFNVSIYCWYQLTVTRSLHTSHSPSFPQTTVIGVSPHMYTWTLTMFPQRRDVASSLGYQTGLETTRLQIRKKQHFWSNFMSTYSFMLLPWAWESVWVYEIRVLHCRAFSSLHSWRGANEQRKITESRQFSSPEN